MSAEQFASNLHRIADGLRNTDVLLRESGDMIAEEIKSNIDKRQNAGTYRVDDAGTIPGEPMQQLSAYTLAKREQQGIHHDHPLKATGSMYRSIRTLKVTKLFARVGAGGEANKLKLFKQMGTAYTGIESSDRNSVIPPRNPVGYSTSTRVKIVDIWMRRLGVRDATTSVIRIG